MAYTDDRLIKVPLPLELIRRMDELLVRGVGGFQSRNQFIREAVEGLVAELSYPAAPAEPTASAPLANPAVPGASSTAKPDWSLTVLRAPSRSNFAVEEGIAAVVDETLFGLHNRDYPSLWLASRLADHTRSAPVPLETFLDSAVAAAWAFAEPYANAERSGLKPAALFPANREKKQAAEQAFRTFAFGGVARCADGQLKAAGPVFQWRICQVVNASSKGVQVALTRAGVDLLTQLDGISMQFPHDERHATAFLSHLRRYATADWSALRNLVELISSKPSRRELIVSFHNQYRDWTEIQAATNVAGYTARAREWGLVEPQQTGGRYSLTRFGSEFLKKAEAA